MTSAVTMPAKNCSPVNLQLNDIQRATTMLINLRPEDIRGDHPFKFLCNKKLYVGTQLERGDEKASNILRKNIYYLARNTKCVTMLIIQLTQRSFFSLDQKEKMLSLPDYDLIRAVDMYSTLLTVKGTSLDRMFSLFENFENAHVADILRTAVYAVTGVINVSPSQQIKDLKIESIPIHPSSSLATFQRMADVEEAQDNSWTCPHCTFKNDIAETNICSLCFKTHDLPWTDNDADDDDEKFDPLDYVEWIACSQCTLLNKVEDNVCQACSYDLHGNANDVQLLDDDSDYA